jgi:predicted nucleic acid-binding protein
MTSSPKKILVDTSVFAGFFNTDDAWHEQATALLVQADEFITTEQVFAELMNVLTRRQSIANAHRAGRELISHDITLLQPVQNDFDEAWKLFSSQNKLSFTDCINIVLAQNSSCDAIATFDETYAKHSRVPILSK